MGGKIRWMECKISVVKRKTWDKSGDFFKKKKTNVTNLESWGDVEGKKNNGAGKIRLKAIRVQKSYHPDLGFGGGLAHTLDYIETRNSDLKSHIDPV